MSSPLLQAIKSAVEQSGKDRAEIAAAAGISRKTLNDLLEGNKDPRLSTLEALTRVLGLRIDVFPTVMDVQAGSASSTHRAESSQVTRFLIANARPLSQG